MLEFQWIKFRNFLSFGNQLTTVPLDNDGTTFITGENLDKGGSSGSGKSSIINAICYCLYDKTPANIGKEKLINNINNNTKSTQMEVILSFKKDGDHYEIRRARGESYSIHIKKNGKDITPDSVVNTNRKIEEIVGVTYDLFTRVVMFNGNDRAFLDLPVHEQRTLVEELLKITTLSLKAVALKEEIRTTEQNIEVQKVIIKQQEAQNELHGKHVEEAKQRVKRWEVTQKRQIEEIESQLAKIIDVDFEAEELLHAEIAHIQPELSKAIADLRLVERQHNDVQKDLDKMNKELKHLLDAKCPYCLQEFSDAGKKINELEDKYNVQHEARTTIQEKQLLLMQRVEEFTAALDEVNKLKKCDNLVELIKIRNNAESMSKELAKLEADKNPHVEALEALESEQAIIIDYSKLDELNKTLEHQKFLLKLLTDKNSFIRKKIISKTIPFLNKRIATYTEELGLPHTVNFLPDMSCEISEFGRELDHGNLSAGEKKRLNLGLCLAFRDVLSHLHGPTNALFTDEVDGGSLDTNSVDALIRLLKHKAWDESINIYIISHRPEFDGRCDHAITVKKENGFSTLHLDVEKEAA